MKRYFAVTLSVLLWMVSALSVSADWNYNDDQLNWGSDTCAHLDVTVVAAVASTCTQAGHAAYTQCDDCGAVIYGSDAALPLLSHSYDAVVTAPDCENGGYTTYTCCVCGDSYVADETEALGHTYDDDFDAECNVCGHVREVSIPGDVNGDGRVNNRDLGILQRYLNEWDIAIDETATDLNGDGKVNNRDLGMIQQLLNR